jgi:nitrogen fixation NifU-like protein
MSDLRELYQEVILDHSRHPRHFGVLDDADLQADGHNPLCGDRITVFLRTRDDGVEEATFHGSGCAISMASASMMTEAVRGATSAEIDRRFQLFHDLVTGKLDFDEVSGELGKLAIFAGVCKFPVRVKCATLAWHTLRAALERRSDPVSTEQPEPAADDKPSTTVPEQLRERVIEVLKTCYDPEIPVDIYELGLIYDVTAHEQGHVDVKMTLTSPMCPVAGSLPGEVEAKVRGVDGVTGARVELVWDPPWDQDMMSEAARLKLGFF